MIIVNLCSDLKVRIKDFEVTAFYAGELRVLK